MAKNLPQRIEPARLCDIGAKLEGHIPLKNMTRLADVLREKTGEMAVLLQFGKDKQGFRTICGKIQGQLMLTCQRCLQPFPYNVDLAVNLSPVATEKAALPAGFEALLVSDQPMPLVEIIEEELMLSLPIIAKHQEGECSVSKEL